MLYSAGGALEAPASDRGTVSGPTSTTATAGSPCPNMQLFSLTPTGLWLRETLATLFGSRSPRAGDGGDDLRARSKLSLLARLRPHAAARPFRVESLSTTAAAGSCSTPSHARRRAARLPHPPTFRPDAGHRNATPPMARCVVEFGCSPTANRDYATFILSLTERRAAFKALAPRHRSRGDKRRTTPLADSEAATVCSRRLLRARLPRRRPTLSRRTCH